MRAQRREPVDRIRYPHAAAFRRSIVDVKRDSSKRQIERTLYRRTVPLLALAYVYLCVLVQASCKPRTEGTVGSSSPPSDDARQMSSQRESESDSRNATVEIGYLKGQLHAHSGNSGDSQTPPADVIAWYARRDFDFLVFTDHNVITREHNTDTSSHAMLVFPGVEITQNTRRCDPPPVPGMACLLHINALLLSDTERAYVHVPPLEGGARVDIFQRAIDITRSLGGVAQLNHPNFHYAADAELIAQLARRGVTLMEVANEAFDSNNQGDADHPSTARLWDAVLTRGIRLWGVATDDAHHYDDADKVRAAGRDVFPGNLGFVMVRARRDRASIVDALRRGDFYSSTGVRLQRVTGAGDSDDVLSEHRPVLDIVVADAAKGVHSFTFIGANGIVLARMSGRRARYELPNGQPYVRAVIEDADGARAFTQPALAR